MDQPSPNGANGRDQRGRFSVGNVGGPGNPHARKTAELRAALMRAVTPEELERAAKALLGKALKGDVVAFRELVDRTLGRSVASDLLERLQALEEMVEALR